MQSTRDIKRRLKSVKNTHKVTKAMELVSAAKMRQATDKVLASREYSNTSWNILLNFKNQIKEPGGLLAKPSKTGKEVVLLVAPDKGLCGGLNSHLLLKLSKFIEKSKAEPLVISVGIKAGLMARKLNLEIEASFEKLATPPGLVEILPISKLILDDYVVGRYNKVWLAYTDYKSTIQQEPVVKQLLPLKKDMELGKVSDEKEEINPLDLADFKFEPTLEQVVEQMANRIIETQIYQAMLEASASEHSARMMAMKNASDSAQDLIDDLTLSYNSARQAGITQELAEISASRL